MRDVMQQFGPLAVAASLLVAGCSGGGDPAGDADAAGDPSDEGEVVPALPVVVDSPTPPDPPDLGPCPAGWREITEDGTGIVTCEPWPEEGPQDCEPGQMHLPGDDGCRSVGAPCPAGDWPEGLPGDREILHADADAPAGGDGSMSSPFSSIRDAVAVASNGTVIALAEGTYSDCVVLPAGVTLWGACAARTLVMCPVSADLPGTITTIEPDTAVRNLTVSGNRPGIWVEGAASTCDIEGVIVEGTSSGGLAVLDAAEVTARDLVVRDVRPRIETGEYGRGIEVWRGASLHLVDGLVEDTRNKAIVVAQTGTTVTLENVVVRDTLHNPRTSTEGVGVFVDLGAHLTADRLVVERNKLEGLFVRDSSLELSGSVVRDTMPGEDDLEGGFGIAFDHASDVTISRCLFERNREAGLVFDASTGFVEDVVVRGTLHQERSGDWGWGCGLQNGSDVTMVRARLHDNTTTGLLVASSSATLSDVTVTSTRPRYSDDSLGYGIYVQFGSLMAERILLVGNRSIGLGAISGECTLSDLEVRETEVEADTGRGGLGFGAVEGSDLSVTRALVEDCEEHGVAIEASIAMLEHLVVRRTTTSSDVGYFGRGLTVQHGAHVTVTNALFEENSEIGIGVFAPDTLLEMRNVLVKDTLECACGDSWCADNAGGVGLGAYGLARIVATDFWVWDSALCGMQIAGGEGGEGPGVIELHRGEVARHPIGVNIQDDDYDVDLLMDEVVWIDNERNLDMTILPIPQMGEMPEM